MNRQQKDTSSNQSGGGFAARLAELFSAPLSGPRAVVMPRVILIVSTAALLAIGLVMVFSSSMVQAIDNGMRPTSYLERQAMYAFFGIVICAVIAGVIPYQKWLGSLLTVVWVLSIVLILLTAIIGTAALGAQRWLAIGPIRFQPSELAKVAFILMMARIMYQWRAGEISGVTALTVRVALLVLIPLAILFKAQSDLGTTMICLVGIVAVLWRAGVSVRLILAAIGLVAVFGAIAIAFAGYRASRVLNFLNPYADPYGTGYQLIHSFYAFGEGGLFGVGLGNSVEKYLYLPEAETDFIFAIIGEELGLIGALIVLGLFVAIAYAGLKVARNAPDLFGSMIAGGCTAMLVFQAFLNIGCVIGLLPITGKPLPFVSSGGSSLIGSFLLLGMILSVSFSSGGDARLYQQRREDLRLVRSNETSRATQSDSVSRGDKDNAKTSARTVRTASARGSRSLLRGNGSAHTTRSQKNDSRDSQSSKNSSRTSTSRASQGNKNTSRSRRTSRSSSEQGRNNRARSNASRRGNTDNDTTRRSNTGNRTTRRSSTNNTSNNTKRRSNTTSNTARRSSTQSTATRAKQNTARSKSRTKQGNNTRATRSTRNEDSTRRSR